MSELFAEVNGIKICYEIHGKGETLILLHGFAMYKEYWIGQINPLSEHFKVIIIDNRGCGASDHPSTPYKIEDMADDVNSLMDYLEIEKAHIGGHSLGGMIAQRLAIKYPERLNKLVLLGTFAKLPLDKSGFEMYKNSQLANYEAKVKDPTKAFYDKVKQRFTRGFYKKMVENPKEKFHNLFTTEELMQFENTKGTSKPQDIMNLIHSIVNHNTLEHLHKIKNQTLILVGDKDRLAPLISGEAMHERIPNSILKTFTGGHWFTLEAAPKVNQTIIDFLKT
ncbi:MAG: alpha/beta fold hydrolase [Candidatus Thorarchaeota archaeon]